MCESFGQWERGEVLLSVSHNDGDLKCTRRETSQSSPEILRRQMCHLCAISRVTGTVEHVYIFRYTDTTVQIEGWVDSLLYIAHTLNLQKVAGLVRLGS